MNIIEKPILMAAKMYQKYSDIYNLQRYRSEFILTKVMEDNGIIFASYDFGIDKFCGVLMSDEDGVTITWNSRHGPLRRNFTIAHELGHFFMHMGESDRFFDRSEDLSDVNGKRQEQQANAFAARLLLPTEVLRYLFTDKYGFYEIAKKTSVSSDCLKWRITFLLHQNYHLPQDECASVIEDYRVHSENKLARHAAIFDILFSGGDLTKYKRKKLVKLGDPLIAPGEFNHLSKFSI